MPILFSFWFDADKTSETDKKLAGLFTKLPENTLNTRDAFVCLAKSGSQAKRLELDFR